MHCSALRQQAPDPNSAPQLRSSMRTLSEVMPAQVLEATRRHQTSLPCGSCEHEIRNCAPSRYACHGHARLVAACRRAVGRQVYAGRCPVLRQLMLPQLPPIIRRQSLQRPQYTNTVHCLRRHQERCNFKRTPQSLHVRCGDFMSCGGATKFHLWQPLRKTNGEVINNVS